MPPIDRELVACSRCGVRVARRLTHRNRAGAYACLPCRAIEQERAGVVVLYLRARILADRVASRLPWVLGGAAVSLAVAGLIIMLAG